MSFVSLCAVLLCSAAALGTKPLKAATLNISGVNSTSVNLANLKEAEKGLVDKLFTFVKDLLADKGTSGRDSNGWRQMGASDDRGELDDINPKYHKITMKKKAEIEPKFTYKCAVLVEQMVSERLYHLGKAWSQHLIGMDIATHFQVQCPGAIPMAEEKCDKHASDLARLVDAGKIVNWANQEKLVKKGEIVNWKDQGKAFLQLHSSGEDSDKWCKSFFVDFWDAVQQQVVSATPQRAPIGPSGSGQLSPYGPSTVNQYGPTDHWTPR